MIYAICTQYRNEQNKLKPWILYHIEQGFNCFILYDDHSFDNSVNILNDISHLYNVNIVLNKTDAIEKTYTSALDTEKYMTDVPLNKRIARSFLNGFATFNLLASQVNTSINDSFCSFTDVDECLTTDTKKSVVETIKILFEKQNTNHIYVPSFDINTSNLTSDFNVFVKKDTQNRWSSSDRDSFMNGKYSHRGKSIIKFGYDFPIKTDLHSWSIVHCAGAIGNNFETAIPVDCNKNCNSSDLRIHHYRIPPNDGCKQFSEHDVSLYNKFKKVYEKYGL